MGHAAYMRGSAAISADLDRAFPRRPVAFEVMDRLNAIPKNEDAATPFGAANIETDHHGVWLVCPTTGFGYVYKDMREIMRRWRIALVGYDATANVWSAIPLEES